jgi:hypothetical protein
MPQLDNGDPCDEPRVCTSGYCDVALAEPVCADEPGEGVNMVCLPD